MNVRAGQELLNELGSSLEALETKQDALLQFLKDKGIVSDDQLAPYLDQAGKASDVRWRAARARLEHLLSAEADKEAEMFAEKESARNTPAETPVKEQKTEAQDGSSSNDELKPEPEDKAPAMEDTTQKVQTKSGVEKDESKDRDRDKNPGPKEEENAA